MSNETHKTETSIFLTSIGKTFDYPLESADMLLNGEPITNWTKEKTAKEFKRLSANDAGLLWSTFKVDFSDFITRSDYADRIWTKLSPNEAREKYTIDDDNNIPDTSVVWIHSDENRFWYIEEMSPRNFHTHCYNDEAKGSFDDCVRFLEINY